MSDARGLTLVEAAVGAALAALVLLAASAAWVEARRSAAATDAALAGEQAARVALDRLAADLRAAGRGIDPDGDPRRPDEALEGAWGDAVALRADLDAGLPEAGVPEAALAAAGTFGSVSTGNDEVVVWALQSGAGETRTFEADVGGLTRDGVVERVDVSRVPASVPEGGATLYRMTLDPDGSDPSAPGFLTRVPVADGVLAFRLRYLDGQGAALAPPGGLEAAAPARRRVRSVRVELELVGSSSHAVEVALDNVDAPPPTRR